ncbi:hypothetical protein [Synechococcus elongatus]|uniref:Transposase n=2 Tax=Synechococcus elongatus TaxID=32046 RepID=Q31QB3_SYNE7|nr:hypothetical protein [Synechococcus elongatus]ABB56756.1 conserved hypothetical protein [Synechococcus elongatus PCC 7942 = FACHB-805]AJD58704.1 hypothetical protein M744_13135 [Synechococcus elongatus UTEX 2973]MBD2588618.1 hypothetical protein [Synechococcus elongatus FACHB-242]MBD2689793.1 hypothetical protein [Synechococcus elongatus FACHB-1061]MBD2708400.1 hypothetical protein [Synechococcus elongatus PCC 7942 = FACHB-805]
MPEFLSRLQYCNDANARAILEPELCLTAEGLWWCGLSAEEIEVRIADLYGLGDSEVLLVKNHLGQFCSEIYTLQQRRIVELYASGLTCYKVASWLQKEFGRHALSQKSVYNVVQRYMEGRGPEAIAVGQASYRGAKNRKKNPASTAG